MLELSIAKTSPSYSPRQHIVNWLQWDFEGLQFCFASAVSFEVILQKFGVWGLCFKHFTTFVNLVVNCPSFIVTRLEDLTISPDPHLALQVELHLEHPIIYVVIYNNVSSKGGIPPWVASRPIVSDIRLICSHSCRYMDTWVTFSFLFFLVSSNVEYTRSLALIKPFVPQQNLHALHGEFFGVAIASL